jgi:hypothetical protein
MLYLARDHRQPYGQPVVPHEIIGDEGMFRSKRIKGITLNHATCGQVDSIKKFMTVRDEISRKQLNAGGDDWNVLLDDGKFRVKFSPYAIDTGAIPRDLVTKVEGLLRGKTPLDLAVMRDTRDQTTAILKDKRLKIPPAVVAAFADVCKQMAILSAPFTRPSPVQRVAWLDEQNTIECIRDWGCFRAGEHYDVATQTITGRKTEKRHRPGFGTEDVLVTGQEVLIRLYANHQKGGDGFWHAFTQFPITKEMPEWTTYTHNGAAHTLSDLIINFAMPEVLDIAEADPASFEKYHKRLQALQSA